MKKYTVSERLKQIMQERNLRQVDILNRCDPLCQKYNIRIGRNDLSQYISGKVVPGSDKLSILSDALGVTEVWLMGYETPANITECKNDENPREAELLDAFDKLDIESQIALVNNIKTFSVGNILPLPKFKKIPLLGSIACGEPILASQNIDEYIKCPENVQADFCLRCKGDSMIGARIQDGDIVYIRIQPDVENGEIAAVLIGDEATLKRIYKKGDSVILQPENPVYEPLIFVREEINQIRILGKAVCFLSKVR